MLEIVGLPCKTAVAGSRSPSIPHTLLVHPLPWLDPLVTALGPDSWAPQHVYIGLAQFDCIIVAGATAGIARTQHYSEEAGEHSVQPRSLEAALLAANETDDLRHAHFPQSRNGGRCVLGPDVQASLKEMKVVYVRIAGVYLVPVDTPVGKSIARFA